MRRVIDQEYPQAIVRSMLIIIHRSDGLAQAKMFKEAAEINGIILTKLDGTAEGGIALAIKNN